MTALIAALAATTALTGVAGAPFATESVDADQSLLGTYVVSCTTKNGDWRGSARINLDVTGAAVTATIDGYQMGKTGNTRAKANVNVRLFANGSTYMGHSRDDKRMDNVWRDEFVASRAVQRTSQAPVSAQVEFIFDLGGNDKACTTDTVSAGRAAAESAAA